MTEQSRLPTAVRKADGRIEPFDGDRISRALFAAGERFGRPDPFLCRELTDGVLHFLTADLAIDPIPIDDLRDAIIKVVRELGHPILARAFAEVRRAGVSPAFGLKRRDACSTSALPADLQAAERGGLIHLFDADSSPKLAAVVVQPSTDIDAMFSSIAAGQFAAIDSPEMLFATPDETIEWSSRFRLAVGPLRTRVVVNLNVATPPSWATAAGGPLFGHRINTDDQIHHGQIAEAVLESLLASPVDGMRVDWHLDETDFNPDQRDRLLRLAERVVAGVPLAFVADRPYRPVSLGEGLDRDHPAILTAVGVGLPRLLKPAVPPAADFLSKLGSLTRLAVSAGRYRRAYLRRIADSAVNRGFILERARLLMVPLGLAEVVRLVTARPTAASLFEVEAGVLDPGDGMDPAKSILLGLNAALARDSARLPAVIDGPPPFSGLTEEAEITTASPRQQLREASALHAAVGGGTAVINLPPGRPPEVEEIADLLAFACEQPCLGRFRFHLSPR